MGRHKKKQTDGAPLPARVRVKLHIDNDAIGPGKIDLLRYIDAEGGISPAARKMGVTFRRAWYLIDTMNSAFDSPLVETEVGGVGGGRAKLTRFGKELIERYDKLIDEIEPSTQRILTWVKTRVKTRVKRNQSRG